MRLDVHALRRHNTAVRGVFKYGYDMGLIEHPIRFGPGLNMPTAAQQRKAKQKTEATNCKRLFMQEEMHRLIDASNGYLRIAVLLGINGGFGNTDVATLPRMNLDPENGMISFPRPKTGVKRVAPHWPETIASLRDLLAQRPTPRNDEASRFVFLTPRGAPLVRQIVTTTATGLT